jgi:hypothetical protein
MIFLATASALYFACQEKSPVVPLVAFPIDPEEKAICGAILGSEDISYWPDPMLQVRKIDLGRALRALARKQMPRHGNGNYSSNDSAKLDASSAKQQLKDFLLVLPEVEDAYVSVTFDKRTCVEPPGPPPPSVYAMVKLKPGSRIRRSDLLAFVYWADLVSPKNRGQSELTLKLLDTNYKPLIEKSSASQTNRR